MQPPQRLNSVPLIGQQNKNTKVQLHAAIAHMAMEIYTQLAIQHINANDEVQPDVLHNIAKDSLYAAKCYFEALLPKDTTSET